MDVEKLKKMAGAVRTGGKGSIRRKKKAVHKTNTTDDKRLQSTLKRLNVNAIPAIEEVNIFKDDTVIQFQNPKVQASIVANTWVVSGTPQTKSILSKLYFSLSMCIQILNHKFGSYVIFHPHNFLNRPNFIFYEVEEYIQTLLIIYHTQYKG
ncbi:hypothetical protein AQUCO_00201414v1 [Aquilegia coerulea]|uniref:Nascent polypeptide-associated complex subunit beta n=1 Tax=Aquilegia coerulea TaxID=218851 RepID=A0A2G5F7Y2_AQUCA|nr:hypothetical protein AQUCO_00201414v1 [Aquilegia coerulea]